MANALPEVDAVDPASLSLVRGDAAWRLQTALGLIPAGRLGIGRRAILLALITWVPIVAWAWWNERRTGIVTPEPMLSHYGITVRCLIAIPLMVVAEGMVHAIMPRIIPYFLTSGVVPATEAGRFREILAGVARLRDKTLPWIFILGVAIALPAGTGAFEGTHELDWARANGTTIGFGGKWFLYFVRPVFLAMLMGWIWRLILFAILLRRISRLQFSLVPSHPDGNGGLGFLDELPMMFSPVVFAISAIMASHWGHQIIHHGAKLAELRVPMVAFLVVIVLLFLAPFFVLMGTLMKAKRAAVLQYGALSGQHGRMLRERWIEGKNVPDEAGLLGAPEMGPVADHISMFQMVERMRGLPIGKRAVVSVLVPAAIPLLVVVSLQVPIKEILLGLVKAIA
jgi:hypothetical protein